MDFEYGVGQLFDGAKTESITPKKRLWSKLSAAPDFYNSLPWQPGGERLFHHLKDLPSLSILTGVPHGGWGEPQKVRWCSRNLSSCPKYQQHVNMVGQSSRHEYVNFWYSGPRMGDEALMIITCWSANKHEESGPGRILIDDREDLGVKWVEKGGVFIHHTDTDVTLRRLTELGVLPMPETLLEGGQEGQEGQEPSPSAAGIVEKTKPVL